MPDRGPRAGARAQMIIPGAWRIRRPGWPSLGIVALGGFASRRLRSNALLAALVAFGLLVASALVTSVPLYSEAVATAGLRQALAQSTAGKLPPDALLFRQTSSRLGMALSADDLRRLDRYLSERTAALIPLPRAHQVRVIQTDRLGIFLGPASAPHESGEYGFFASISDLARHATLAEGRWPADAGSSEVIEAAMLTGGIDQLGIRVGEEIRVQVHQGASDRLIPVRIVGRWDPADASDPYWFVPPDGYRLALIVPDETLLTGVSALVPQGGRQFTWYVDFDPRAIRAGEAGQLAAGIAELRVEASRLWRGLRLEAAPDDLLERYQRQTVLLEALLFALGAPLVLIALQFVAMAAGLRVEQQRGEIATLKSRGASTGQIIQLYLLEGALLATLAVAAGPPLGAVLATGIGQASGFFGTVPGTTVPVAISRFSFAVAAAAAALALIAALQPAIQASRTTVVTMRQELARSLRPPLWRRAFADLLPVPVAAYGYLLLRQRQSVVPVGAAGDAVADPLLLLAPALFILAATLAFLRILPALIRLAEQIARWLAGPSLLLALRQLARQPDDYRGIILMLVLTLAIGVFSASAALTIDLNQASAAAYQAGTDLRVAESGAFNPDSGEWTLLPISDYLKAPGVESAARVARLAGKQRLGGRAEDVQILAVSPADFYAVAVWRDDFADQPFAALMQALGPGSTALVDRRTARAQHLAIGDELPLTIKDHPVDVVVAGFVDYFPTLSPDQGPFLVMNLDQVFDEIGPLPSEVWLRLAPDASDTAVVAALTELGLPVSQPRSWRGLLAARQADLSRQGTFGLLAIGFLVGAGLSILSFLVYSYLSFRRRLTQIGILRAIGLGSGQLVRLVLAEQLILIVAGVAAGLLLGLAASALYVPFLQLRESPAGPPTLVVIAWSDVARLVATVGGGLLLVLPSNLLLLRQVRLHEAIKLGDEA